MKMFAENHGKAALMVVGATVVAALIVIPIANKFLGSFLPQGSIKV
ncbi:MAG TPA: hypothetical protein VKP61_15060 [Candidatus Acidoferrum sp.]|nr:hypothetical protein [Candidatus Acidoferrum sp.]